MLGPARIGQSSLTRPRFELGLGGLDGATRRLLTFACGGLIVLTVGAAVGVAAASLTKRDSSARYPDAFGLIVSHHVHPGYESSDRELGPLTLELTGHRRVEVPKGTRLYGADECGDFYPGFANRCYIQVGLRGDGRTARWFAKLADADSPSFESTGLVSGGTAVAITRGHLILKGGLALPLAGAREASDDVFCRRLIHALGSRRGSPFFVDVHLDPLTGKATTIDCLYRR